MMLSGKPSVPLAEFRRRRLLVGLCFESLLTLHHRAANTGTAPSFSDDDLYQLREHGDRDVSLEKALALPPLADPIQGFWKLLVPFMHHITNLARETSSKLTGVRARAAERIDEDFAADFLARVDVAVNAVPELVQRSKFFEAIPKGRAGQDVGTILRSLRVTLYNLMRVAAPLPFLSLLR